MSDADRGERRAEAQRWLGIAKQDVSASAHCLAASPPLTAIAAYHCQQAAEKIAKAVLVAKRIAFPKTHDLATLKARLAAKAPLLASAMSGLEHITVWGFAYRYPFEEDTAAPQPSTGEIRDCLDRLGKLMTSAEQEILTDWD